MEIKELRKLSTEDLVKKIKDTKEELFTKRMQHARMKTILKEREIDGGNK